MLKVAVCQLATDHILCFLLRVRGAKNDHLALGVPGVHLKQVKRERALKGHSGATLGEGGQATVPWSSLRFGLAFGGFGLLHDLKDIF